MKKWLFLVGLFLVFEYASAQGCSQCKIMAEQGSGMADDSFTNNINYGILYLMAFPYLILFLLFRKQIVSFLKRLFVSKN